jgi:hypothetical protein
MAASMGLSKADEWEFSTGGKKAGWMAGQMVGLKADEKVVYSGVKTAVEMVVSMDP